MEQHARVRDAAVGVEVASTLLLYGFSRGAQMAHRFSMVYPSEVAAVAVLAAGSYTMPHTATTSRRPMPFPFGVADLSAVARRSFDDDAFRQVRFGLESNARRRSQPAAMKRASPRSSTSSARLVTRRLVRCAAAPAIFWHNHSAMPRDHV